MASAESDADPHAPIKLSHGKMQLRSVPTEGRESREKVGQVKTSENMAPARGRTPHLCPSDFAVTVSDVTPRVAMDD